ncbi:MAG: efflux RND transporter periplasmic adaptor subunit [Anaerolineae bacterium]|nr:efflux RND transporter periplasmic adaptor subunit [Anaerolineae bacterium]
MMMRKHYRLILSMVLVVMLAGACQAATGQVTDEPLTASGTIRATEILIGSETGGRILEVRAEVGSNVKKGDVMVVMDSTPLLVQAWQKEAAVVTARADLEVARAGPRPEAIAAARAALSLAEAKRDGALVAWENDKRTLESPQELDAQIIEARTQVSLAAQGVELAEAQLARQKTLRDQSKWGSDQYRVAELQVQAAEEALAAAGADEKTAQTLLDQLLGIRQEPLAFTAQANVAEGQYRVAEAAVAVAQAELDDLLAGPTREEIAVAEATLRHALAEVNVLGVQIDKCTSVSPMDGVVLYRSLRAGELAAPAVTILALADTSEVTLEVYVPENRVGQVKLGQSAEVTVDSFPGRTFEGRVVRIADEPEFTPRNTATAEERLNTFYAVEIILPNPEGLLKPGIPADATIV